MSGDVRGDCSPLSVVDGMALANTNRIQAEAALAAMTQHKNNWKARALDMEVHKNNWKAKAQAGLNVSTVGTAPAVATQDNYRNASTEAAMYNGVCLLYTSPSPRD